MRWSRATDAELLAATGSDPQAFGEFYDRFETAIVGYLLRRTGDVELAIDLAGEVFATARWAARGDRTRIGLGPRQRRGDPLPNVTTTTLHQTQETVRGDGGLFSSDHCRANAALYFVPVSARMTWWRSTKTGFQVRATTVRTSLNAYSTSLLPPAPCRRPGRR